MLTSWYQHNGVRLMPLYHLARIPWDAESPYAHWGQWKGSTAVLNSEVENKLPSKYIIEVNTVCPILVGGKYCPYCKCETAIRGVISH